MFRNSLWKFINYPVEYRLENSKILTTTMKVRSMSYLSISPRCPDMIDDVPCFKRCFWTGKFEKINDMKIHELEKNPDISRKGFDLIYIGCMKIHGIHFQSLIYGKIIGGNASPSPFQTFYLHGIKKKWKSQKFPKSNWRNGKIFTMMVLV